MVGQRAFRKHAPGSTFVAALPQEVERRALERGAIKLVRRERRGVRPGSYTFPKGWLPAAITTPEAAEAAFSLDRKEQ